MPALPPGRASSADTATPTLHGPRVVRRLSALGPVRRSGYVVTSRASGTDYALYYELDALRVLAARVIDEHVGSDGTRRACGRVFPCPRACLAEHNLDVCGDEPPRPAAHLGR
jgi:hypothetical protein